ncbi:MAG TPA: alanine racemase [Desulfotignum sp.]|nr:alanine racemase [Desulfotignum sp.]
MTLFCNHYPGRAGSLNSPAMDLQRALLSRVSAPRIEVDLDAVARNTRVLHQACAPNTSLMGVVKANAYGHGAAIVADTVLSHGADYLGVARMYEAVQLREAGIQAPVLVFGDTLPVWAVQGAGLNIQVTLTGLEAAKALNEAARAARTLVFAHIKIDTGMGRLGLCPGLDMSGTLTDLKSMMQMDNLAIEGIYTHFANADAVDLTHAEQQLALFTQVLDRLDADNLLPKIIHAANSAATLSLPRSHFTMVRPGIALYGLCPGPGVDCTGLTPALSIISTITQIKQVPKGFAVSYGSTHVTDRPTTIATVPVGYADGYSRLLSAKAHMLVRGQRARVAGRVCMDFTMIDVGHIPDAAFGDEVVVMGTRGSETVSADELAEHTGTINYEVVAGLTSRLPVCYRKQPIVASPGIPGPEQPDHGNIQENDRET